MAPTRFGEAPARAKAQAGTRQHRTATGCSALNLLRYAALITLVAAGPAMVFALSVLVIPFEQVFKTTRVDSSSTASFAWTAQFVMTLPTSYCFRRFAATHVLLLGAVLSVGGCVLAGLTATTMLQVHLLLGGMSGIGQGILWSLACFLVPVYFPSQISFANGIVYGIGNGLGILAWSFGLETLLQEFEWRLALLLTSAASLALLLLPLSVLLIDHRRGLIVTSTEHSCDEVDRSCVADNVSADKLPRDPGNLKFSAFIFSRNAIMVAISYTAFCVATLGIFGHLSAQVQNLGMTSSVGAEVVALAGFAGMTVRPFWGSFADRFHAERFLLAFLAAVLSVLLLFWNICSTRGSAIFFGCALGMLFNAYYTTLAGLIWAVGGKRHFNNFYSVLNSVFGLPGCLFSSVLYGMVYTNQGNYWMAGFGGSALLMISAVSPLFIALPKHNGLNISVNHASPASIGKERHVPLRETDMDDTELCIVVL